MKRASDQGSAALADRLADLVRVELRAGTSAEDIAAALTGKLPGLVDRRAAQVHVMNAFDRANRDSDRALPFETGPFELDDLEDFE